MVLQSIWVWFIANVLKIMKCVINDPKMIGYASTIIIFKEGYVATSTSIEDKYVEEPCIGIALI